MEILLYSCAQENNVINKNLELLETIQGDLREESSIMTPVVMIESITTPAANYAMISEWNRYYYINNIISERTGLWRLEMSIDVLKTYASEILANKAVIRRQQTNWNIYLDDPNFKVYNNKLIQTKLFPNGFNNEPDFILVVAGG